MVDLFELFKFNKGTNYICTRWLSELSILTLLSEAGIRKDSRVTKASPPPTAAAFPKQEFIINGNQHLYEPFILNIYTPQTHLAIPLLNFLQTFTQKLTFSML